MEYFLGKKLYDGDKPYYLNPKHPNYKKWERSRENSILRGSFVYQLIKSKRDLTNCVILDIGSGFGGTLINFASDSNKLYSLEIDKYKLYAQPDHPSILKINADAFNLPFENKTFDVIILQDVIEHVENPFLLLEKVSTKLKDDGIIYLSTPNKFSIINLISDPHWGLPFVCLLNRKTIQRIVIPTFRPLEKNRTGIAQLMSLKQLLKMFEKLNLSYVLSTSYAVNSMFESPEKIAWSSLHLIIIKLIKKIKLDFLIKKISNDRIGFLNRFITPTFYFLLFKKN